MARIGNESCFALAAVLLLTYAAAAALASDEIDVAPTRDWCKVTGGVDEYALNPAGACVKCLLSPGVTWQVQYGVCPTYLYFPRPYNIVKKGEYKQCVCAAGYWGSPKGFPKGDYTAAATFIDLGCYCCDPGRTRVLQSPVNATSPFQCNVCNSKVGAGTAPFCQQKSCPAGAKRGCPDCPCRCQYDPFASDEGRPDPPCPVPQTEQCKVGVSWDFRAKKCKCEDNVYRPDAGCKCAKGEIPYSSKTDNFKEPKKGGYCSECGFEDETKLTENGKKVCSCSAGNSITLLQRHFGSRPSCWPCTGANVTLNSQGLCTCAKGLWPFILGFNEDEEVYRGDFVEVTTTCRTCKAPAYKVTEDEVCVCGEGYALGYKQQCVPCTGPGYKIEIATPADSDVPEGLPVCRCDVGYFSTEVSKDVFACTKCPSGAITKRAADMWIFTNSSQWCYCKDPLRDLFNKCACKFGYQEDGKGGCVKKSTCSNSLSASFWKASQLPSSWTGGAFPAAVLSAKPASILNLKVPFSATSLKAWTAAGVPASIITAKFAAQLKGCVCRPPTPLSELKAYTPESTESEFFVVVEKADVSMTAGPPLRDEYLLGDSFDQLGLKLRTPVLSVTNGSTGSKHVGQVKAAYIHEVCLQYDIKLWADAPQSKGPMLSVYVYTAKEWGSY